MKLWLLERTEETDYDEALGFVVRAESADGARKLVARRFKRYGFIDTHHTGGEGPKAWLDAKRSSCVELKPDGAAHVILRSFHSG